MKIVIIAMRLLLALNIKLEKKDNESKNKENEKNE